ncbi:MAG: site-specific integrase, partial [bacterium]
KTETSEREISFPEFLIPLLKRHKTEQLKQQFACGENWHKSDRLFTTWNGKPMHPSTPSNWFDKFLKKKGLPNIPFHGLRHTSATLLIAEGIHAKVISSRLGHSNISTTMDIYGHFLKSADKEAANVFEKYNIAKQK